MDTKLLDQYHPPHDYHRAYYDLYNEYSWIADTVEEFDVTNVGTQYELVDDIRANKDAPSFDI